jgi:Zn2+/Cd2+-exporting ATPase
MNDLIITTLSVPGLDCPAEEELIRNKFKNQSKIIQLDFNFIAQEVTIRHQLTEVQILIETLRSLGMRATIKTTQQSMQIMPAQLSWWWLGLAGCLASAAEIMGFVKEQEQHPVVIILAVLAILLSGKHTIMKGIIALRTFTLNINFLMMIAITGAMLIGEWPEAAMVTVLFAIAERIESYSMDKARQAISNLITIAPEVANVQTEKADWQIKPLNEINAGEIIWVKPGERVPLDGILVSGESSVNQSPITGESMPVKKNIGDTVYAGTINERGSFKFRVQANSSNTLLAKIIRAVQQAQAERAPTQRFVEKFAHYYTPLMVLLAILIAVLPPLMGGLPFYPWLYKALVLLVIACPCALVISTPLTIVSGLTAAAKHGVLIKGGVYLELGHKLTALALDKTGTITQGKPIVTQFISLSQQDDKSLLQLAASLDIHSEHPIATAIVNRWQQLYSDATLLPVSNFEAIVGKGVTGIIKGQRFYVGNHQLVEDKQICSPKIEALLEQLEKAGNTTIIVATDRQALAVLAVADTIRETSIQAIQSLHQLNIKTIMMTGDNKLTAQAVASHVGIDEVLANLLPTDKLTNMNNLLQKYHHVGMVGDGINDAPALAKATIGFAMGKGTDTAIETADVALMDDNLKKLAFFISLSRRTASVLKQNISLAIGIKALFFVLALMNLSTLWLAVFADMGASLLVVGNGLRLLYIDDK